MPISFLDGKDGSFFDYSQGWKYSELLDPSLYSHLHNINPGTLMSPFANWMAPIKEDMGYKEDKWVSGYPPTWRR